VRRFDRAKGGGRIPYLSAGSMLQASRADDHAYTQIAGIITTRCVNPASDPEELCPALENEQMRVAMKLLGE
jgi:serine/threonine-protein kinase HipA